jgi:L-ribulose-5-phosphate 4-epimerase
VTAQAQVAALRSRVHTANLRLPAEGLVTLTWGNVSGRADDGSELVAIKPSGVPYEAMEPDHMVVLSLDGDVFDGALRPSTDTPTHLALYRAFPHIGGIVHVHSTNATALAQARSPLPCLGTTHADHFAGEVPVTRSLTAAEVAGDYEAATGAVIVERFAEGDVDPEAVPAALVAGHGPFVWGPTPAAAVDNAVALEAVALMALQARRAGPDVPLEPWVLDRHNARKHGPDAYYGQATGPNRGAISPEAR